MQIEPTFIATYQILPILTQIEIQAFRQIRDTIFGFPFHRCISAFTAKTVKYNRLYYIYIHITYNYSHAKQFAPSFHTFYISFNAVHLLYRFRQLKQHLPFKRNQTLSKCRPRPFPCNITWQIYSNFYIKTVKPASNHDFIYNTKALKVSRKVSHTFLSNIRPSPTPTHSTPCPTNKHPTNGRRARSPCNITIQIYSDNHIKTV